MFPLDLHVVWREGDVGVRGVEVVFFIFLMRLGWNLGHEDLSIG